jgi:hypothetical protein
LNAKRSPRTSAIPKGYVEAKVVHSCGRAGQLDKAALERLIPSIRLILDDPANGTSGDLGPCVGNIEISREDLHPIAERYAPHRSSKR